MPGWQPLDISVGRHERCRRQLYRNHSVTIRSHLPTAAGCATHDLAVRPSRYALSMRQHHMQQSRQLTFTSALPVSAALLFDWPFLWPDRIAQVRARRIRPANEARSVRASADFSEGRLTPPWHSSPSGEETTCNSTHVRSTCALFRFVAASAISYFASGSVLDGTTSSSGWLQRRSTRCLSRLLPLFVLGRVGRNAGSRSIPLTHSASEAPSTLIDLLMGSITRKGEADSSHHFDVLNPGEPEVTGLGYAPAFSTAADPIGSLRSLVTAVR
ncbi:hypothetical protein ABID59_007517 [Bradyrhizobium sp. S3.3.6]